MTSLTRIDAGFAIDVVTENGAAFGRLFGATWWHSPTWGTRINWEPTEYTPPDEDGSEYAFPDEDGSEHIQYIRRRLKTR